MADSNSPSSPLLPAFQIRELNGAQAPPGVVQITASQYDRTIDNQPDAVLSYVDLDDGETITVGSAFELEQRLEEPTTSPTPLRVASFPAFRVVPESDKGKMMHIFDIQQTSASLALWKDRQDCTRRRRGLEDEVTSSSPTKGSDSPRLHPIPMASSEPLVTLATPSSFKKHGLGQDGARSGLLTLLSDPDHSTVGSTNSSSNPAAGPGSSDTYVSDTANSSAPLDKAFEGIFRGLESHLGPLADVLESTADGLRKIAEKTAEADTTPVENVLKGFKSILTEVGGLGLHLLASLDEKLEQHRLNASENTTVSREKPPTVIVCVSNPDKKRVDFIDNRASKAEKNPVQVNQPTLGQPGPKPSNISRAPVISPSGKSQAPVVDERQPSLQARPADSSKPLIQPRNLESMKNFIIDSQPADADFLHRYPPLPSLRKAVSAHGLRNKPLPSAPQSGLNTTSALSRYPSIWQLEEESRLRAKTSSSSSPKEATPPPTNDAPKPTTSHNTGVYKKPTVEDVPEWPKRSDPTSKPAAKEETPRWPLTSLPGAWPDQKADDWSPALPTTTTSTTNPPKQTEAATSSAREHVINLLTHRVSSPVSETYSRAPIFPRKSQTVSSTNPAARLNGPFDPLAQIPVLQPRPQRSQPDLSATRTSGPSQSNAPPFPGYLPQRGRTVHHVDRVKRRDSGPFSQSQDTLWDNFIKNNHSESTIPSTSQTWRRFDPNHGSDNARAPHGGPSWAESRGPRLEARRGPAEHLSARPAATQADITGATGTSAPRAPAPRWSTLPVHPAPVLQPAPALAPVAPVAALPAVPALPAVSSLPAIPAFSAIPSLPAVAPPPWPTAPANGAMSRGSSFYTPSPPMPFTRPRGRSGVSPPTPSAASSADECVKALKAMGFGSDDPIELSRLNVYAGAAAGNVEVAIEMIEEDREAARELDESKQLEGIRTLDKDEDIEGNPWDD